MAYNRYGYYQGNNYQQDTSQAYNYGRSEQGWQYSEQNYMDYQPQQQTGYQNFNNYSPKQVQKFQNRQNLYYQQAPAQQYENNTMGNYYRQLQYSNSFPKWQNMNKRPHEYIDQTVNSQSHTTSPEPKRQVQKQNSFQYPNKKSFQYNQNFQHAAYETPNQINPPQQTQQTPNNQNRQKTSPKKKSKLNQQINPVLIVQEEKSKEWSEKFNEVIKQLSGCRAGEEVNMLLTQLQPTRNVWEKRKSQIQKDLMILFKPLDIEKVFVFGSTLTGLDFHGSDLDYYVQLKTPPANEEVIKQAVLKAAKLTRYNGMNDFQIICTIQNARVPILRLLHKPTKITCDVNFSSKFGYYNSYFISHILGYDKRIKELAVILKLWSKSQKLAQQMIISNYCLMMLLIFYLQNLENPILDSIENIQKTHSPMILDMKYKWNFYFNGNINLSKNNQQSLRELLTGFFEFYDKINCVDYVLSVYTGNLIKRNEFDTLPALEECRNIVKASELIPLRTEGPGTFCIQDGFELNLNVGIKVKKHADYFFQLIKMSYQKCIELKDKPFSELLTKLLTDIVLPKTDGSEGRNKNKKQFQMTIHALAGDLKIFQACQDILMSEKPSKVIGCEDQQKLFFEHTLEYTQKFLKEFYLCTVIPEISEDIQSTSDLMQSRLKVILQYDTINGRKKMNFKDDETIQAETLLSTKMAEKKIFFGLDCLMVISSKDKGKTINFDLFDNNNVSKKSSLLSFGNYFSVNISSALKFYLKKRVQDIEA